MRAGVQLTSNSLASAVGCSSLNRQILPSSPLVVPDAYVESATSVWNSGHSEQPPSSPDASHQQVWDAQLIAATYHFLLECASNLQSTCLLAVATPESGAWFNALPISWLGLRMEDDIIWIAVGLRLDIPLVHHLWYKCGCLWHSRPQLLL